MSEFNQLISYDTLVKDFKRFKKNPKDDVYDNPGTFYFKILFYFNNDDEFNSTSFAANLLGPVESVNTALSFLERNNEQERAGYLRDFIGLLSNLSTECPWIFKSIEGLEAANERTYLKDAKFEEEKSINIKCMQDTVDTRITTLLELYRSACYSHRWKKEIVPANLRKFDMGIYVFQVPYKGASYNNLNKTIAGYSMAKISDSLEFSNCKYFELHNCEIDPNSIKTCFVTLDNEKGVAFEPTITIKFDDCFTSSYNEELVSFIGDLVHIDMDHIDISEPDGKTIGAISSVDIVDRKTSDIISHNAILRNVKQDETSSDSIVNKFINNVVDKASNKVKSTIQKAVLGNVYGFSLANAMNVVNQFNSGDMLGTGISAARQLKSTANSAVKRTVVSDVIPSIVGKKDLQKPAGKALGSVAKNIVRNL